VFSIFSLLFFAVSLALRVKVATMEERGREAAATTTEHDMKFTNCHNTNEARALVQSVFFVIAQGGTVSKGDALELMGALGDALHLLESATPSRTMIEVMDRMSEARQLVVKVMAP
jgi:ribosomal protein L35AE/L33A